MKIIISVLLILMLSSQHEKYDKKQIIGKWESFYQGYKQHFEFLENDAFYLHILSENDSLTLLGDYKISGKSLLMRSGSFQEYDKYTIKSLEKKTMVLNYNKTTTSFRRIE